MSEISSIGRTTCARRFTFLDTLIVCFQDNMPVGAGDASIGSVWKPPGSAMRCMATPGGCANKFSRNRSPSGPPRNFPAADATCYPHSVQGKLQREEEKE